MSNSAKNIAKRPTGHSKSFDKPFFRICVPDKVPPPAVSLQSPGPINWCCILPRLQQQKQADETQFNDRTPS